MARGKKVTTNEWEGIKSLLNSGWTIKAVCDSYGRSYACVSYVKKSDSFADYKAIVSAVADKKHVPTKADMEYVDEILEQKRPYQEDSSKYITSDFEHVVVLQSQGYTSQTIPTRSPRVEFVFNLSHNKAIQILDQYFNHDLMVDPYTFYKVINDTKTRIYALKERSTNAM